MKLRVLAVIAALFAAAGPKPAPLPIALVSAFDEAIALATSAAEARIAELEARPIPAQRDLDVLLGRLDRAIAAREAASTAALDAALTRLDALSPASRATLACRVLRHLVDNRRELAAIDDPRVAAEYRATDAWLVELRHRIG